MPNNPPFPQWSAGNETGTKKVLRCRRCAAWSFEDQVLCGECRAPLVPLTPLSERIGPLIGLTVLLAALTLAIVFAIRWLVR